MNKLFFPIIIALLAIHMASQLCAEGLDTHSAYRVTSYNLGALLNAQGDEFSQTSQNFKPLLITSGAADILNNKHEGTVSWGEAAPRTSNISGIAVSAEFNATENLSVQGTFGLTRNLWTPDSIDYESESSWEANLGVIYKLLGNLSYELHLGYMDTGDLFKNRSSYTDVESIIMVNNRLTLSF